MSKHIVFLRSSSETSTEMNLIKAFLTWKGFEAHFKLTNSICCGNIECEYRGNKVTGFNELNNLISEFEGVS